MKQEVAISSAMNVEQTQYYQRIESPAISLSSVKTERRINEYYCKEEHKYKLTNRLLIFFFSKLKFEKKLICSCPIDIRFWKENKKDLLRNDIKSIIILREMIRIEDLIT